MASDFIVKRISDLNLSEHIDKTSDRACEIAIERALARFMNNDKLEEYQNNKKDIG
jgi:hypothetical protein